MDEETEEEMEDRLDFEARQAAAKSAARARTIVVVGFVLLAIGGWMVASAMEASSYERVTGVPVSMWDAMWIELRVQGEPR